MSAINQGGRFRLVLMSIGCLVGTSVLECIERLGRSRFDLIGLNSEPDAANNFRADTCYLSPPSRDLTAMLALLDQVVRRHEPHLIVPCRDDDVVALSYWAQANAGAPALVGSVSMAEVIRDKWASFQWAVAKGLPFARSATTPGDALALRETVGLPLVSKPRDGFGSHGVRMLLSDDHLAAALAAGGQVIQEPLDPAPMLNPASLACGMPLWFAPIQPGSPLGLCVLDDKGPSLVATWSSRHVRGAAIDTTLFQDSAFDRLTLDYARAAWDDGWRGLFSIQARRARDGGFRTIELAGRFMGGTNALDTLGIPVTALVLRRFIPGFDIDVPLSPRFDAKVVKQVSTHLIETRNVAQLQRQGVWDRVRDGDPAGSIAGTC